MNKDEVCEWLDEDGGGPGNLTKFAVRELFEDANKDNDDNNEGETPVPPKIKHMHTTWSS